MRLIALWVAAGASMMGCATQPQWHWYNPEKRASDGPKDLARCDYETSAATQMPTPGFRSMLGQEIDKATRKAELMTLCMRAAGWERRPGPPPAAPEPGLSLPMAPPPTAPQAIQPRAQATPPQPSESGQFAHIAERIPEVKACAAFPQATLVSKGPGFEVYSVACRNSDTMMVRCEMGNCRPLK